MDCIIRTEKEYQILKKATAISKEILDELLSNIDVGVSAATIDELAYRLCKKNQVEPAFLGVVGPKDPYQNNICISVNHEILHAIPYRHKFFQDGDIIKVDFGIKYKDFYTDHCQTIYLGQITEEEKRLVETSKLCIEKAIEQAIAGNTVGDISNTLQTVCELAGFDYVKTYCGHGIGRKLHLPPEILAFGKRGTGMKLVEGMVLCLENQIVLGSGELVLDEDGWTLRTQDGSKGAMTEKMVIVRKRKAEVLT